MIHPVTAVLDANILYPAPLRDLFIRLAQEGLLRAKWTETIHDEWIRNVLANNSQVSVDRLLRTKSLMNEALRDCVVVEYEVLIETLSLPDPDDRHVLAAAIRSGADVIITCNLKDFPSAVLLPFGLEAKHPDDFLVDLFDFASDMVCLAIKKQREGLRNPPKTAEGLLATFNSMGLPEFTNRLKPFTDLI